MWDEDDEFAAGWWVAAGWAEMLVEHVSTGRGPAERSARDSAAVLLYHQAVLHRCRPGLVQLGPLQRLHEDPGWPGELARAFDEAQHRQARACLAAVDVAAGRELLAQALTGLAAGRPGVTPVEDLWPGVTLLARGGGGPTW